MVCVERWTKKMSIPGRKNLNLLDVFKKGKLLRDFDALKPLFLISNFLLALLYIGTTLEYLTSAMFFRNASTTDNDTTSTNKKKGGKNDLIWSHRNNTILFFLIKGVLIYLYFLSILNGLTLKTSKYIYQICKMRAIYHRRMVCGPNIKSQPRFQVTLRQPSCFGMGKR